MPSAEIIAVGTELLTPDKSDTNSLWLTSKLNEIGVEVKLKTVVGDDPLRLEEAISDAYKRSDLVITTGGLGPTEDDITRACGAAAIGKELVFHEELLEELKHKFKAFGYEMPERNRQQAYLIEGAKVLPNPNGSAVGMMHYTGGKALVLLPGPPREMKPMFSDHVLPTMAEDFDGVVVLRQSLRVTGLGESKLDEIISPIYTAFKNPVTSTLFSRTDIEVQLTATAATKEEAESLNNELAKKIAGKLGDSVFSMNGEPMEVVVGRMLLEKGKSLAVAESCTGGLVSKRLTDVPGSSGFLLEGCVTYSNNAKMARLGVPSMTLDSHGAVSAETAEAMAVGMRETAGSDVAVSITGIAGPGGGTEGKPVGTVFVGYADTESVFSKRLHLPGDRNLVRWRSSQAALDCVRRQLL
ncbi:MAG: competence/damage-inducible protein A [Pyrinomonadaceae bacterium]|nr:competence/damage-inducible protein A [Pyrinomonadaceae bacterium]